MTKLESLDLSSSSISSLPSSIGRLENIKELNLSKTNILTLPIAVGKQKNLKESSRSSTTKLTCGLPNEIESMINLEKLNLSSTDISSLPDFIGNLKNLKNLDLSSTSKLQTLPASLGKSTSKLRVLNLTESAVVDSMGKNNTLLLNIVKQCPLLGCVGRSGGERLRDGSKMYTYQRYNGYLLYDLKINRARSRVVCLDESTLSFPLGLWKLVLHKAKAASDLFPCGTVWTETHPCCASQLPQSDAIFHFLVERGAKEIFAHR